MFAVWPLMPLTYETHMRSVDIYYVLLTARLFAGDRLKCSLLVQTEFVLPELSGVESFTTASFELRCRSKALKIEDGRRSIQISNLRIIQPNIVKIFPFFFKI